MFKRRAFIAAAVGVFGLPSYSLCDEPKEPMPQQANMSELQRALELKMRSVPQDGLGEWYNIELTLKNISERQIEFWDTTQANGVVNELWEIEIKLPNGRLLNQLKQSKRSLVLWPEEPRRLGPGESYTIVFHLSDYLVTPAVFNANESTHAPLVIRHKVDRNGPQVKQSGMWSDDEIFETQPFPIDVEYYVLSDRNRPNGQLEPIR